MIKHVYQPSYAKSVKDTIGYIRLIEWISTEFEKPAVSGKYLTSDGNGCTIMKRYSTYDDPIHSIIFNLEYQVDTLIWNDTNEQLTPQEIINLCYANDAWYDIEDMDDKYGEYAYTQMVIYRNPPKYWLGSELNGPTEDDENHSPIHIVDRVKSSLSQI